MKRLVQNGHRSTDPARRGVATLWLVLALPVFLILFGVLIEGANLWLARGEFKAALDAAALAAVQHWEDTGNPADTEPARNVGVSFAFANEVAGQPVVLDTNFLMGGVPNENLSCDGDLVFGAIDTADLNNIIFDADTQPDCGAGDHYGVRAQGTITVNSVFADLLGLNLGTYELTARSDAMYDCVAGTPRLVHITTFTCTP